MKKNAKQNQYIFAGVVLVVLILAVVGYFNYVVNSGTNGQNPTNPQQTQFLPPEGNPSIQILSPQPNDVIAASSVGVKLNVTNFRLAGIVANRPNQPNEGHVHSFLDGDNEKTGSLESFAYTNVPDGQHTLRIELRNNDDSPLVPAAYAIVTFTVKK